MKLRRREFCPVHRSLFCCGRSDHQKTRNSLVPIRRVDDPHHPRGYREIRSPAEMKRLLKQKIKEQNSLCGICGQPFTDVRDIVPDHKQPRGMGGAKRDDHPDNIQAAHRLCNQEKGSKRQLPSNDAEQSLDQVQGPTGEAVQISPGEPNENVDFADRET